VIPVAWKETEWKWVSRDAPATSPPLPLPCPGLLTWSLWSARLTRLPTERTHFSICRSLTELFTSLQAVSIVWGGGEGTREGGRERGREGGNEKYG
jgi:hypothetical protein